MGDGALIYGWFVLSGGRDWYDGEVFSPPPGGGHDAVTLTLCQPVEPFGAIGARLLVWV